MNTNNLILNAVGVIAICLVAGTAIYALYLKAKKAKKVPTEVQTKKTDVQK